ncbi:putative methyltransferase [Starmerella bacillaris]|uniref:Methyltransferase n=1 Tax=Starmerella bacillaris TaxID=1247836 RepID=A0AAV5RIF3_STABA|nr:putative methyltransferase [Starmerella bacillaris]
MVSIAIPSTCIGAQTCTNLQQATFSLYEVSRACAMFNVTEIVIYDVREETLDSKTDLSESKPKKIKLDSESSETSKAMEQTNSENRSLDMMFSANMLQYFITPRHLRTLIFKGIGNNRQFKYAQKIPEIPYINDSHSNVIQGIAVPRAKPKKLPGQKKLTKKNRRDASNTKYINIGFDRLFALSKEQTVPVHSQVFVDFKTGEVVSGPRQYTVRAVKNFSHIFTESPFPEGYEQTLFVPCQHFKSEKTPLIQEVGVPDSKEKLMLIFGKWDEVQLSVKNDEELELEDAADLFDGMYPTFSKARLEDVVMVSLAKLS